jgi:protein O-GlcNAc transferase
MRAKSEVELVIAIGRNMVNVAATFYKATLSVTTGLSAPYSNLATIYKQQV